MLSEPRSRPITAIDAELRLCHAARRDAALELDEVRRRQTELAELEATLALTVETRRRHADRLLDERLRAVTGGAPRHLAGAE